MADRLTQSEKKTAFNPRKPGQFAGDFNISRMILTSVNSDISADDNAANFIDLTTSNWNELNFYEDIYSPVLSGDITITDTTGIVESFPIIGEEVLEVTFSNVGAAPSSMPDPATALTDLPVEEQEKIGRDPFLSETALTRTKDGIPGYIMAGDMEGLIRARDSKKFKPTVIEKEIGRRKKLIQRSRILFMCSHHTRRTTQ